MTLREQIDGSRLTVLQEKEPILDASGKRRIVECRCACGTVRDYRLSDVKNGHAKSCGCYARDHMRSVAYKHGMIATPEYRIWACVKTRCLNQNDGNFLYYGAKGITVCEEWRDSFEAFYRDMGPRPSPKHSIDRIDNTKGYCKENCRWATLIEQSRNKSTNRFLTFKGETRCLQEWGERKGIKSATIRYRIEHGWPVEKALTTPVTLFPS